MAADPGKLPKSTRFSVTEQDILSNIFASIKRDCPNTVADRARFMRAMERVFDSQAGQ